ncbi:(d)CMP kinase [Flavobacteriaceae bacterium S0825]|uniref:(d)CMP kinase n=1 Tax=Gaetbulibacter sp. S0825 TaxID=2720084 RepID=UPI00142F7024|nr:(d)CMP kinase [Gaetbulibacter sp. S0825]MCK0109859.1 (d)CMP kinase [Flavobacteriaceae bacterium S0825]NIX65488.1 (d)CMP kinase [Gaetbulibacter sp. S0825]
MQNITIAIDGFSSTGKSTLAKQIAKELGYVYVDTGAMYRAVTLYALQNNFINENSFKVNDFVLELDKINLSFKFNEALGFSEMYLNDVNVEKEIRTLEVSSYVSKVSAVPEVRYQLVKQQQKMGEGKGIVMDGRDIGTVVFPQAELKIFMTASPKIRAQRRYDELIKRGDKVNFDEVLQNVQERDYIDSHREDSPLIKAQDAIEIDNTNLTLEEQFESIMNLVRMTLENQE